MYQDLRDATIPRVFRNSGHGFRRDVSAGTRQPSAIDCQHVALRRRDDDSSSDSTYFDIEALPEGGRRLALNLCPRISLGALEQREGNCLNLEARHYWVAKKTGVLPQDGSWGGGACGGSTARVNTFADVCVSMCLNTGLV
jgi:hypothetical protein